MSFHGVFEMLFMYIHAPETCQARFKNARVLRRHTGFAQSTVTLAIGLAFAAPVVAQPAPSLPVMPNAFVAEHDPTPAPDAAAWWATFRDPLLDELLSAAVAANHDVRIALARVELARAGVSNATADLLPSVSAIGATSRSTTTYDAVVRRQLPDIQAERAGAQVSWEIDLFGRARAGRRAAQADALAAEDAHRGAVLMALADTAEQYFTLRGAQDQRRIVTELIGTERETLRLTELRHARGTASEFDIDRARAELAETESSLPRLDSRVTVTLHRLAVLTGRAPGAWDEKLVDGSGRPIVPVALPAGQPPDLLLRRPDVLAAEAGLASAGYRLDAARAVQFPQLFVSALFGSQWTDVNALDIGRARFANVASALALPLFAGGRIHAGIAAARAEQREALARYEQAVLRALVDVESALTSFHNDSRRAALIEQSVDARLSALRKAQSLYRAGEIDLLQLLDVERGLLASRLEASDNTTLRLIDAVQTYRALGGGWEQFEKSASTGPAIQSPTP